VIPERVRRARSAERGAMLYLKKQLEGRSVTDGVRSTGLKRKKPPCARRIAETDEISNGSLIKPLGPALKRRRQGPMRKWWEVLGGESGRKAQLRHGRFRQSVRKRPLKISDFSNAWRTGRRPNNDRSGGRNFLGQLVGNVRTPEIRKFPCGFVGEQSPNHLGRLRLRRRSPSRNPVHSKVTRHVACRFIRFSLQTRWIRR